MSYENLTVNRDGHIATVQFNRPQKANATNYGLLKDIEDVSLSFRDDTETRVVIFTGAGKHFSSGMDLSDPNEAYQGNLLHQRRATRIGGRAVRALCDIDQITIAAWHGAAIGGGAVLTTAADFRIGAQNARMYYPEVDIGMNLMWFGLPLLVHLVGPTRAKRIAAGGEQLSATQLLDWGLLDELVDGDDPMPAAIQWAEHYAAKPPIAVQMIKQSVNRISSALDYSLMHMDVDQNLFARTTEDSAEALRAYLAKETPTFSGN